jgi:tripartite ATP-independent transporter DctP family solute receptor
MVHILSRKQFIAGAAATLAMPAVLRRPAMAAQFTLKLGHDIPVEHPLTTHLVTVAGKLKTATDGQVELQLFPNNQLGNDNHMLSQLRSGAMQMMAVGDNILAEFVPPAAIDNFAFAFKDSATAYAAVDGEVGALVRGEIEKIGLHPMTKMWVLGFRQMTASTRPINAPADLHGFKMRVPPSPISLSMFRDLGAAPMTLNAAEMYTALQTHLADGQENPLGTIEANKIYEVQKYCSMTSHMWVGYWVLANGSAWKTIPAKLQDAVAEAFDSEAPLQRADVEALNNSLVPRLQSQGMTFNNPDRGPFREALVQAGFYKQWQGTLGPTLWSALEKYSGPACRLSAAQPGNSRRWTPYCGSSPKSRPRLSCWWRSASCSPASSGVMR